MKIKYFKNGNINVKIDGTEDNHESLLINLIWALEDCQIFGEEYCMNNLEMAIDMYDYYTDMIIRLPFNDVDKLEEGKTVKFYAHKLDLYEREFYNELRERNEL